MNFRSFCFAAVVAAASSPLYAQCFDTKIVSPLGTGARFGSSVSVVGDALLVGAPGADAVVFYRRVAGGWVEGATFTGQAGSSFGYDVSVNGDLAIVGAPFHDETSTATTDSGAVQLFVQGPPGTWTPASLFLPPNAQDNGHYGWAVDTDGDQVLVGAPGQNSDKGNARLYDIVGGQLTQAQNILAVPIAGNNSRWGYDVAIDGPSLVIGAPRADVQGFTDNGMGAFYRRQFGNFVFQDYWTFMGPSVRTGVAVAIDDGQGVLQAAAGGDSLLWAQWDGFAWALEDFTVTAFAGEAVALSGNRTFQGAPELSSGGLFTPAIGGVRMYTNDGGPDSWGFAPTASSLTESTTELGTCVAIDGDTGVAGEPLADDSGIDAGAIHVYDTSVSAWDTSFEALTFIESTVNGIPFLSLDGSLCADESFVIAVGGAAPNALMTIVVGFSYLGAPFKGGTLGPQPDLFLSFTTSPTGSFSLTTPFPADVPASFQFFLQAFVVDAGAPKGLSASNTQQATTPTLAP